MTKKRLEGRGEAIVEPDLPILDTHHHLFLRPAVRYLFDDFQDDVRAGHRIVGSVYVEAQSMLRPDGPELMRPLGEVEFANGMGAMAASGLFGEGRVCAAIVAHADLMAGDAVAEYLDAALALAPQRLRGVRQIVFTHPSPALKPLMRYSCPPGMLMEAKFRAGFRQLVARGLSFDATVFHTQLDELCDLADAFPEADIVLDHLGLAMNLGLSDTERAHTFEAWREGLRRLARHPKVCCKVGGLGMPYWGFGFERREDTVGSAELATAWRPWVETAVEVFGAARCMVESNFPPDGISCGWVPLWNALKLVTRGCSADERASLFHRSGARFYRVALAVP
jgi:predicted TIM-barrel fold metal-dependent hydrolase